MYRKLQADAIFTGREILLEPMVLIAASDGTVIDIVPPAEAGSGVELMKGMLCPGFINCHCHIELSHLKGKIQQHEGLVPFLLAVLSMRNVDNENKLSAMKAAVDELYLNGTVAVGDICNEAASVGIKRESPLYWVNFVEVSGFVNSTADQRFDAALEVNDQFATIPFPHHIVPHAPYSVSQNLFRLINDHARKLVSIHNQESAAENELYQHKEGDFLRLYAQLGIDPVGFSPSGKSSLQTWYSYFTHKQQLISVHNTFLTQADIDFAKGLIYCVCLNANLYIENKLPPLDLLIKNQCNIVVGTDSYASNMQLNMIEEMKAIQKHFPDIKTETILTWATSNGADALAISDQYGNFLKGKKPGIVLIENLIDNVFTEKTSAKRLV